MTIDWAVGFEAVRPWLTTGFIGSILAVTIKFYIDKRRLELAEKTRGEDFQLKMSADGRTNLQFIIDNLVRDINDQRDLHAGCQAELADTKQRMGVLEKLYDGLQRQFVHYQIAVARAIPPSDRSPEVDAMLLALEMAGEQPHAAEEPALPRRRWRKRRNER